MEDETHIPCTFKLFIFFRENLFNVEKSLTVDFISFNNEEKIMFLLSNENMNRIYAKTCFLTLERRRNSLYCNFFPLICVHKL